MAIRGPLDSPRPGSRRRPDQSPVPADSLPGCPRRTRLHATLQVGDQPLLPRRRSRPHANPRLGRCLDIQAQHLCSSRPDHEGRRRRRQLRPPTQPAPRREGRRAQLSRHIQRAGFPLDLDAKNERGHASRRIRGHGLRGARGTGAGGHDRGRRCLGPGLRRRDDSRGRVCPGRRMHDGRRCGPGSERRLRQFLQGLRSGRGQPAPGRGRHRGRRRAHRQRLHEPGSVLGPQGRRRRQPGCRHPA